MKSSKNQVACFCDGNGGLNGFKIAHLTDKHHIWIFTQNRAKCSSKTKGIVMNFTLSDDATLRFVSELDWIFDSNNMSRLFTINLIYQCSESSRFAGASRASNQNQTTWKVSKSFNDGRHAKLVNPLDFVGNETKGGS